MTACPTPESLTKTLKNLHARTVDAVRPVAENVLAMQTTDPARHTASVMQHMMGIREQATRDLQNKMEARRAAWGNFPEKETWGYLKLLESRGTEDMIEKGIAQGKTRSQSEAAAKNDFASAALDMLKNMNPGVDATHLKAKAEFMANEAVLHRAESNEQFKRDQLFGSQAEYRKDYIAHLYKNVERAQQFFTQHIEPLGPTWYQKERLYDLMEQAVKDGLELKYPNPIDIIMHRERASIMANSAVDALRKMRANGDAVPTADAKEVEKTWTTTQVYAGDRQAWSIRPEAWNVVHNAFDQNSLSNQGGVIGSTYDAMRQVKNVVQPINLGLSAFHAGHEVVLISPAQSLVRALRLSMGKGLDVWAKNMIDAGKFTMKESIVNWPLDKIGLGFGKALDELSNHAFSQSAARTLERYENMSPEQRAKDPTAYAYVKFKEEAGAKFDRPWQESSRYTEALKQDWADKSLKIVPHAAMAALESIQKPLFNYFIPGMKRAHWMQEVAALYKLHPDIFNGDDTRKYALQQITRNLDDRFGEMSYNNLFMNKLVKDAAVISSVSFSWNYGFARQMGGGIANMARAGLDRGTPLQQRMMVTDEKAKFIMAYAGLTAALGGVMTYMLTGTLPQGTDYLYPRTGLTNDDGTPARLNTPTNFRDIPMAIGHSQQHNSVISGLGQLLWSKLILQPYVDAVTGKDWKGGDLYDSSRPWIVRQLQLADSLLGESFSPAGVVGAQRASEVPGAGGREKALAYAGFAPAPKYVGFNALENRILQMSYDRRGPQPYEYGAKTGLGRGLVQGAVRGLAGDPLKSEVRHEGTVEKASAQAQGNPQGVAAANQKLLGPGLESKGAVKYANPKLGVEKAFAYLPLEDQQALVKDMKPGEFARFVRTNPAFGDRKIKPNQTRLLAAAQTKS
jgi:hypothetical protein